MSESLKRAIFSWVPPAAIALAKGLPRHNWHGVYEDFASVPSMGNGYEASSLADETVAATIALRSAPKRSPSDGGILATIATDLARTRSPLRIVDFGGGAGVDYILLRAATAAHPFDLDYCVVEHPRTCNAARKIYDADPIRFVSEIEAGARADLVFSSAALSYVDDWRATLLALIELRPNFVILANTLSGDFPTFATAQRNLPGMVVPYWFFSYAELVGVLGGGGYRLVVDVPIGTDYDHTNLPIGRRPGRARNLVFRYEEANEARS